MSKPKSKQELLDQSQGQYERLIQFIDALPKSDKNKTFSKDSLNKNIRDIVTHLHHWHLLMINWYTDGMNDIKPNMPAKGYTWKTLPDLNKEVWKKYQKTSLTKGLKLLDGSYNNVQAIIKKHSDADLFEKKKYAWTGSTSLGAYLIMNSVSHYNWAMKQIKRGLKD